MAARLAVVLVILGGVVGLLIYLYQARLGQASLGPPCLLYRTLGWYCPGCGGTRATQALLHLDVVDAWRKNGLYVAALPLTLLGLGVLTVRWVRGAVPLVPWPWMVNPWFILMLGVVTVLFGVLRNLPWAPWSSLAPH